MGNEPDKLLSTAEVATRKGVTRQRVLELITEGRLPAIKVGRAYVVRADDAASLELGKPGRPLKAAAATSHDKPRNIATKATTAKRGSKK